MTSRKKPKRGIIAFINTPGMFKLLIRAYLRVLLGKNSQNGAFMKTSRKMKDGYIFCFNCYQFGGIS